MKTQKFLLLAAAAILSLLLAACSPSADTSSGKLNIVTTTGMIADIASNLGGDQVNVEALMGPGIDPHLYAPSEGDLRRLGSADLILYNGLHLEAKLADALERIGQQKPAVAVAEAIPEAKRLSPPDAEGAPDPHVWFDVELWKHAVESTRDALVKARPDQAELFKSRADDYLTSLTALHNEVKEQIARIPKDVRVMVTAHDAFHYFGRAYDIEVRGLQGISTVSEAGTRDVQELAAFIAERKLPAIFVESSVPRRNIEAVQEAVRAKGWDVKLGKELFSDAMGNPGTPGGTYMGMVRHNVQALVEGLGGTQ